MKKTLLLGLLAGFATAFAANAADDQGTKPLTAEQQQTRDSIIQKYDANKDGVLDKTELKQISKADKKALAKTGGVGTAKKADKVKPAGDETEKVKPAKEKPAKEAAPEPQAQEKAKEAKAKTKGKK